MDDLSILKQRVVESVSDLEAAANTTDTQEMAALSLRGLLTLCIGVAEQTIAQEEGK